MFRFILSLVSLFFTLAFYVGIMLLFYRSIQYAKAKTLDQLIAELVPRNTAGWTPLYYLIFFARAMCFIVPAVGWRLVSMLCSWVLKSGVAVAYKTSVVVESVSKCTTGTTTIPSTDPVPETEAETDPADSQPKAD